MLPWSCCMESADISAYSMALLDQLLASSVSGLNYFPDVVGGHIAQRFCILVPKLSCA